MRRIASRVKGRAISIERKVEKKFVSPQDIRLVKPIPADQKIA